MPLLQRMRSILRRKPGDTPCDDMEEPTTCEGTMFEICAPPDLPEGSRCGSRTGQNTIPERGIDVQGCANRCFSIGGNGFQQFNYFQDEHGGTCRCLRDCRTSPSTEGMVVVSTAITESDPGPDASCSNRFPFL